MKKTFFLSFFLSFVCLQTQASTFRLKLKNNCEFSGLNNTSDLRSTVERRGNELYVKIMFIHNGHEVEMYFIDNKPKFSSRTFSESKTTTMQMDPNDITPFYMRIGDLIVPGINSYQLTVSNDKTLVSFALDEVKKAEKKLGTIDQYIPELFLNFSNLDFVLNRALTPSYWNHATAKQKSKALKQSRLRKNKNGQIEELVRLEIYRKGISGQAQKSPIMVFEDWQALQVDGE
ncbi:MAG: hypothetical protein KDD58_11045 [Bdellovibrionales bacterium]|nr:hypothetical protein [Bdellovibrionales bacterium]